MSLNRETLKLGRDVGIVYVNTLQKFRSLSVRQVEEEKVHLVNILRN